MARVRVDGPPTFTVAEAADRMGVPRREVREMIDSGRLRALWLAGAARVTREEVGRLECELTLRPRGPRSVSVERAARGAEARRDPLRL